MTSLLRDRSHAAIREAWTDILRSGRSGVPFGIATVGGVVLAILAPFGMVAAPMAARLIYWVALLNAGTLLGIVLTVLVRRSDLGEGQPLLAAGLVQASNIRAPPKTDA